MIVNKFKKTTKKKDTNTIITADTNIPITEQPDTIIFNPTKPSNESDNLKAKVDVLDIPEEYTEPDFKSNCLKIDTKAYEKYNNDIDKLFNANKQMIDKINTTKKHKYHEEHINNKPSTNVYANVGDNISIRVTENIINDATPLLKQLPPEFLNNIKHTENPPEKPSAGVTNNSFFSGNINISGDRKVLILRNTFKNIQKLYSNFFEFVEDNIDLFRQNTIIDNPTYDKYKYIIYDKSIINQSSVYNIYKSWNNDSYEKLKSDAQLLHSKKLKMLDENPAQLIANYITIVICVRENFHFLVESINSVIEQTCSHWRIVIINDGSSKPVELDEIYGTQYYTILPFLHKIKIINNVNWNGVVYCQTQALEYVQTEIVGILDCDDKLDKTCVEQVLDMYKKFSGYKDVFVITDFKITDDKFNFIQNGFTRIPNKSILQDGFGLAFRSFKLRDYYRTAGYNPKFRYGGEDVDLIYKLETVCTPIFLNRQLYYYRRFDIISDQTKKKKHLSTSKYHKYNCLMAKIINGIERYGNIFKLRIYSRTTKNTHERMVFQTYIRVKKPLVFRHVEYYIELYLGTDCQLSLGLLKGGNTNDLLARHFIMDYINTGESTHRVYIKYSFEYRCLVINDRPVDFSIDDHLALNVNNLYDNIYISIDDNILDVDLDKLDDSDMKEYRKYILEKYSKVDENTIFNRLGCNFKSFSNLKNII